jgi:curved DNA-binding protein
LSGQGAGGSDGSGDLFLKIKVLPHAKYQREGDDLKINQPVEFFTALLGGEVMVTTIDKAVNLTIPPETDSGKTFRLKGLGMPILSKPDQRGDLYATIEIQVPKNLSTKQKEEFQALQQALQTKGS